MNTNLRKLITALLTIALIFALSLSVSAAEINPAENTASSPVIPVMYDDDIFTWDENPGAIADAFKALGQLFAETDIAEEEIPLSAAPAAAPVMYDDDIFAWDENPGAIADAFKALGQLFAETDIAEEEIPLSAAPAAAPVMYDDDIFTWDENLAAAAQIVTWINELIAG